MSSLKTVKDQAEKLWDQWQKLRDDNQDGTRENAVNTLRFPPSNRLDYKRDQARVELNAVFAHLGVKHSIDYTKSNLKTSFFSMYRRLEGSGRQRFVPVVLWLRYFYPEIAAKFLDTAFGVGKWRLNEIDDQNGWPERLPAPEIPESPLGLEDPRNWDKFDNITRQMRFNEARIDVVGRKDKRDQLLKFLEPDEKRTFVWWQIAGAAGQGKSRLAIQLFTDMPDSHQWEFGFKRRFDRSWVKEEVKGYQPANNLLIVVDYVAAPERSKALFDLIEALRQMSPAARTKGLFIRLLVIERQPYNPESELLDHTDMINLPNNWQHQLITSETWEGAKAHLFDQKSPLFLQDLKDTALIEISDAWAKHKGEKSGLSEEQKSEVRRFLGLTDKEGQDAHEVDPLQLHAPLGAHRPLFAILATEAVLAGEKASIAPNADNMETLLAFVLDREAEEFFRTDSDVDQSIDAVIELRTTVQQRNMAYLANIIGCLDAYSSDMLLFEEVTQLSRLGVDIEKARNLLGYSVRVDRRADNALILAREPTMLAGYQVLREHTQNTWASNRDIFKLIWEHWPNKAFQFLKSLAQDFPGRFPVEMIADAIPKNEFSRSIWENLVYDLASDLNESTLEQIGKGIRLNLDKENPAAEFILYRASFNILAHSYYQSMHLKGLHNLFSDSVEIVKLSQVNEALDVTASIGLHVVAIGCLVDHHELSIWTYENVLSLYKDRRTEVPRIHLASMILALTTSSAFGFRQGAVMQAHLDLGRLFEENSEPPIGYLYSLSSISMVEHFCRSGQMQLAWSVYSDVHRFMEGNPELLATKHKIESIMHPYL